MKVTILKHHEGYYPNDKVDIPEELARYWIAVGVATEQEPNNEEIEKSLTKKLKAKKKK